jgi:transcription factor C subunit 6
MARALRPRKSRPSYVAMAGLDLDGDTNPSDGTPEAGPSKKPAPTYDEADSGSDFSPEKDTVLPPEDPDDEEDEVLNNPEADEDEDLGLGDNVQDFLDHTPKPKATKGKSKAKFSHTELQIHRPIIPDRPPIPGPSIPRGAKRQMYVLPAPSVHHRHRAVPLYSRMGRVERLASRPSLFKPYEVIMTNNFTQNHKVTDRVNKSWGYNVGNGPLWEMVEDRGWYKEAIESVPEMDREEYRRPRVYQDIGVKSGWEVLNEEYVHSVYHQHRKY